VEKIIEEKPFLQEALSKGIVNNAALAKQLIPEIEKALKRRVKFSAANMAIRRLSEKLEKNFVKAVKFDESSDVTMRSDLVEITFEKNAQAPDLVRRLQDLVDFGKGDFLTVTMGLREVMAITNSRYRKAILKVLPRESIVEEYDDLCGITVKLPEKSSEMVGLFYIITRALAWENLPIIDFVSTCNEATLTFKEKDATRAFTVLKRLIGSKGD
jgi:hypothetical protein